jgi:PKD domain
MTLDIILLIATIVVAVAAVFLGLIRAVLERRREPLWAQYRSRRIDPQRLERAVPGPTPEDGTVRALERQAPAMGSRPSFAALGAPVAAEPVVVPEGERAAAPADEDPAPAYAYIRASDEPDAEPDSMVVGPVATVVKSEADVEAEVEPDAEPEAEPDAETEAQADPDAEPAYGLSDAAMAELGIVVSRLRSGSRHAAVPQPVEMAEPELAEPEPEPAESETVEPAAIESERTEPETVEPAVVGSETVEPETVEPETVEPETVEPAEQPAAASSEPVPLFLPGTYTVGAADDEEPAVKRDGAPVPSVRAAAMTAGYAPTARAVFVPPPPDVIEDELAYRMGVRGARRPSQPSADAAGGPATLAPVLPTVETESWPAQRRRRRRAAVGLTGLVAVIAAVFVFAVVVPTLGDQGGVLEATGRPQASDGGGVARETPGPTLPPAASQPAPSKAVPPSAAATATPAATPKPTPSPTRKPTPKPIPYFDCTVDGLTVSCDASASRFAESYVWEFSEGTPASGVQASHTYANPGSYQVMLTVTSATGSNTDGRSFTVGLAP